jgi:Maltokinase N-terminal cap domain
LAVIHQTTLVPSKLELLTAWLPRQDWYAGQHSGPSLAKVGGFRLDDPAGQVGIEFMVVRDDAARQVSEYLVPMTYRASSLAGADAHLIGLAEHGVLGPRWIYDGAHDPVLLAQLGELIQGRGQAQAQSQSNTLDATVQAGPAPAAPGQALTISFARRLSAAADGAAVPGVGEVTGLWTAPDGALVRSVFATARPMID